MKMGELVQRHRRPAVEAYLSCTGDAGDHGESSIRTHLRRRPAYAAAMRVASLLPAATEIVCAIGADDVLVGVSHECDYPARLPQLPRLTRARAQFEGLSGRIHESVTTLVEQALSIYEVDAARLAGLRPDAVLTQDLCDVCAVSGDDVRAALSGVNSSDVELLRLHPQRLEDIFQDILRVGKALQHDSQAAHVVDSLRARLAAVEEIADRLPRREVLLVEWLDPVMAGGLWSCDLAALAGARALASEPGGHARTLAMAELTAMQPDVVVIKPCGFDLARSRGEIPRLPEYLPWSSWRAAAEGRVFLVDGNAYFNRPGPRIVDSTEILAACVHPDAYPGLREQYVEAVRRILPDLSLGAFL